MTRRISAILWVVTAAAAAGATTALRAAGNATRGGAAARVRAEAAGRDADIAFYVRRVAADPIGAADRSGLAGLYLQRARETADFGDYRRAERLARRSLELRVAHNENTYVMLASALLAQHRFVEAHAAGRALNARAPGVPGHQALLGEIALELGRYREARTLFDSLWPARHELAVAPRLARWVELTGRTDLARRLLDRALADAKSRPDLPPEQVAWFHLRVGDLALRTGRLTEAEFAFRAGLDVAPADYRLLAAQARLAAARGRWREAIAYGDEAIATLPDPATFGVVSDAYAGLGDSVHAAEYAHAMEVAVLGQPGQWHRAWSLFLLDHDRRVPEVLAHIRKELETRRDVYGYDLLAWALHKAGGPPAPRPARAPAAPPGPPYPPLLRHAAAIGR